MTGLELIAQEGDKVRAKKGLRQKEKRIETERRETLRKIVVKWWD